MKTIGFNQWLDTFIEEKGIDTDRVFTIHTGTGFWDTHIIPVQVVIDAIHNTTPAEQEAIFDDMLKLDLFNQPILPYLEHLAKALAANTAN